MNNINIDMNNHTYISIRHPTKASSPSPGSVVLRFLFGSPKFSRTDRIRFDDKGVAACGCLRTSVVEALGAVPLND